MELENGLISYYETPRKARVRQIMLRVVPIKFRRVVMSEYHVPPLEGQIHDQINLFSILARFWWPMVNKEAALFMRAFENCQLVNSCSHKAHQLIQTIESDTPFDVVFIDFW